MLRSRNDGLLQNGKPAVQEARRVKRFRVTAPVVFSWADARGQMQRGEGMARDISMRGILVITAELPDLGAYMELDVYLPPIGRRGRTFKLHGEGKVLRIEQRKGGIEKFAAEVFFQTEPYQTVVGSTAIQ
jgi:hypothetical protein